MLKFIFVPGIKTFKHFSMSLDEKDNLQYVILEQ